MKNLWQKRICATNYKSNWFESIFRNGVSVRQQFPQGAKKNMTVTSKERLEASLYQSQNPCISAGTTCNGLKVFSEQRDLVN